MPKDNEDSGAMAAKRPVRRTHQFWWIALLDNRGSEGKSARKKGSFPETGFVAVARPPGAGPDWANPEPRDPQVGVQGGGLSMTHILVRGAVAQRYNPRFPQSILGLGKSTA